MKFRWIMAMGHQYHYHVFSFPDPIEHQDRLNDRLGLYIEDGWEPLSITHTAGGYPTGQLLVLMRREKKSSTP